MIHLLFIILIMQYSNQEQVDLFDFKNNTSDQGWIIVNDGVMGGLSEGNFSVIDGSGVFQGEVSTRNNGGFTMVRNRLKEVKLNNRKSIILRLKGDGKRYQFRVKSDQAQRHAYIYEFETSGDWEEISIPFENLVPKFRGRSLEMPVYDGEKLAEIAFLIGNKRDEAFKLQIQRISVE